MKMSGRNFRIFFRNNRFLALLHSGPQQNFTANLLRENRFTTRNNFLEPRNSSRGILVYRLRPTHHLWSGTTSPQSLKMSKVDALHQKVGEVKGVVADNLEKVQMRGERIDELDERAALLRSGAKDFKKVAVKTRAKHQQAYERTKRCRWIILITFILILVTVIVVAIVVGVTVPLTMNHDDGPNQ